MFKDLTKEVPPIMNVLNIHENLLEVLLEMGNYADVQVIVFFAPFQTPSGIIQQKLKAFMSKNCEAGTLFSIFIARE